MDCRSRHVEAGECGEYDRRTLRWAQSLGRAQGQCQRFRPRAAEDDMSDTVLFTDEFAELFPGVGPTGGRRRRGE